MAISPPTACLEPKPTKQSIYLAGRPINLRAITRAQGIDHSYLSRIFSGRRVLPRVGHGKKIAAALGMSYMDFLDALEERLRAIEERALRIMIAQEERVTREDGSNLRRIQSGRAPRPTLPGTR